MVIDSVYFWMLVYGTAVCVCVCVCYLFNACVWMFYKESRCRVYLSMLCLKGEKAGIWGQGGREEGGERRGDGVRVGGRERGTVELKYRGITR